MFYMVYVLFTCIWRIISSVDIYDAVLFGNFTFHAGAKDIFFAGFLNFWNVSVFKLRGGRSFNNAAMLYDVNAKTAYILVFINAVDNIGYVKCRVVSSDSKIVVISGVTSST